MDIYIDGSSIGNPGEASVGIIFQEGDITLKNISRCIGKQTNNVAEYTALVFALQEALIMKARDITVYSDSELLCKQLKGEYRVKNEAIKSLFLEAKHLIQGFENFKIQQIPREKNRGADKLARLAIKNNPK
jgi:ribonuclease HI